MTPYGVIVTLPNVDVVPFGAILVMFFPPAFAVKIFPEGSIAIAHGLDHVVEPY